MRSLVDLSEFRRELRNDNAYGLLLSLFTEAVDAGGQPFTRSIFTLSWGADIPPPRIKPLLAELAEVGAIEYHVRDDGRTIQVEVL